MAKISEKDKQFFQDKLFKEFPDIEASGNFSRQQVVHIREKYDLDYWPVWLMTDRVGRGLYAIPGGNQPKVVGNNALKTS